MLRSSLPTLMTEDQLSAVKAALTAAAASNPHRFIVLPPPLSSSPSARQNPPAP